MQIKRVSLRDLSRLNESPSEKEGKSLLLNQKMCELFKPQ